MSTLLEQVNEQFGDGWPARWRGNCHYAANMLLEYGLVQGELRYGSWIGPIDPRCPEFGGRPFTHHGWVEREDGSIVDPTRWVFEHVEPYIYEGPNDHYDIAGNKVREMMFGEKPLPEFDESEETYRISLPLDLLDAFHDQDMDRDGLFLVSLSQMFWLANLSPAKIGGKDAAAILYRELERVEMDSLIPIDNRKLVLGR